VTQDLNFLACPKDFGFTPEEGTKMAKNQLEQLNTLNCEPQN
jgi:hypothetical protein